MTDHANSMLRKRREKIREQTRRAEKRVMTLRCALANLDAAIAILTPEHPDYIAAKRATRRGVYFKRGELSRLVRGSLERRQQAVGGRGDRGGHCRGQAIPGIGPPWYRQDGVLPVAGIGERERGHAGFAVNGGRIVTGSAIPDGADRNRASRSPGRGPCGP